MSRYNLKFVKTSESTEIITYDVSTCDFSEDNASQQLGELTIELPGKTFSFRCSGIWSGEAVVPMELFSLPINEGQSVLKEKYSNAKYTDWMFRIYKRAEVIVSEL